MISPSNVGYFLNNISYLRSNGGAFKFEKMFPLTKLVNLLESKEKSEQNKLFNEKKIF